MKIPLNWLKEYVELPSDVEELTQKLTAIGHMQDKKPEKIGDDTVIDLEVRQNRPDCLSILGIAREVAAVTNRGLKVPSTSSVMLSAESVDQHQSEQKILKFRLHRECSTKSAQVQDDTLSIQNTAHELCKRFNAHRIRVDRSQSTVDSPSWIKDRLQAYGIKTISPLVDITNYVTIELGEPLHAFDIRHVEDGTIVIRRAKEGEKLTILGGKVLTLTTDDLVISSKSKALSLAGMIGGAVSGVHPDTTEIVLEAATYNQASIRRSSIRHSVRTEASTRHEKFLHPHLAEIALQRAASLIVEICGGEIVAHADSYPDHVKESTLDLRLSEVERLGGVNISAKDAENYLASLGFTIVRVSDFPPKADQPLAEEFRVSVPYWRTDIEQEADLVEEILRLYGYEHIPASLPPFPSPKNITSYWFKLEEKIRDVMLQLGFDEQITEPLTKFQSTVSSSVMLSLSKHDTSPIRQAQGDKLVKSKQIVLQNALNANKNALRTNLAEGLTHALSHQKKFGKETMKLFELGKVYGETGDKKNPYFESRQLGFIMYDSSTHREVLYLNAKGVVETLCKSFGFVFTDSVYSIQLVDETTAFCTVEIEKHWGPDTSRTSPDKQLYTGIPNFQKFDISMYLNDSVKVGEMIRTLSQHYPSIEDIDYVISESNKQGKKNVLLKFLTSKGDKDSLIQKITKQLQKDFVAEIR